MNIRKIKKEELLEVCKLSSLCFEYPFNEKKKEESLLLEEMLSDPTNKGIRHWDQIWGAFDEETAMLSCLNVIPFLFQFDGSQVLATGIGNVCTYPQHRKKGAIKSIFQTILPDMYENNILFSYLYPFSEGFYRKFGYERMSHSTTWDFDLSCFNVPAYSGKFSLYQQGDSLSDFKAIYDTFSKKHNLMVMRDDNDWSNVTDAKAAYNNNYAYLYKDIDGIARGYLVFKREVRGQMVILNCRELIFDSPDTLKALLSFCSTYAGDFQQIHFQCPSCYNLEYLCKDYPQSTSHFSMAQNGMVRVVNAKEVLKLARYQGSGTLFLKLTDDQICENSHIFQITYENGAAEDITISDDSSFDIAMTIPAFSAAISGGLKTEDLYWMDSVDIKCSIEKLSSIFYQKPCWINNYF